MRTLLATLLLWSSLAFGQVVSPVPVKLTWTNPTTNTDGSTLTDLSGTKVYRSTGTQRPVDPIAIVNASAVTYTDADVTSGTKYYYWVSATTPRGDSETTGPISYTVPTSLPNPPTNLRVAEAIAYEQRTSKDTISMASVGTVPVGTTCDGANATLVSGTKYNLISRDAVNWTVNGKKPDVVYAQCT